MLSYLSDMINIYENIEEERERIEHCLKKFGWTSDHNLDWFIDSDASREEGRRRFAEFSDGSGLLASQYQNEWRIWSDPLTAKEKMAERIVEFSRQVLGGNINKVWCDYVTDFIRPQLLNKNHGLVISEIDFSLIYLVLDMNQYDPVLPGHFFKEIRNAKNKFYREHKVKVLDAKTVSEKDLYRIIDAWKEVAFEKQGKEYVCENWYQKAVQNGFRGFTSVRVIEVDGRLVGINGGYEVINRPGCFAGIIGLHDYSYRDLGTILWLEDLEWAKNRGYREFDMQGWEENDPAMKFEMRLGGKIDRRTDTFAISLS